MRSAQPQDIPTLVALMADFYAEAGFELDRPQARAAFAALLSDARQGAVWLIEDAGEAVGYLVVALRFTMEYGGSIACLDDLYVQASHRRRGLAAAALSETRAWCKANAIRAITVEVGFGNAPAQAAYRRMGLQAADDRQLLVLPLDAPTHLA
jgi:GNAT superfamily N-acetyltransferase